MPFSIRNLTASNIELGDLGFTIFASTDINLRTKEDHRVVADSSDLRARVNAGEIAILDSTNASAIPVPAASQLLDRVNIPFDRNDPQFISITGDILDNASAISAASAVAANIDGKNLSAEGIFVSRSADNLQFKGLAVDTADLNIVSTASTLTFNASPLDARVVHLTGDETIEGNKTFSCNIVIQGDLTINGTLTSVSSTDLVISDNVITLNNGETSASITLGTAGIEVDRGTGSNAVLIYNEATDTWQAGLTGNLESIVTSGSTLGAGGDAQIFVSQSAASLEFRSLTGVEGISISQDGSTILISASTVVATGDANASNIAINTTNIAQNTSVLGALDGKNLGGSAFVFVSRSANNFQFRGLSGGGNISIVQNASEIVISAASSAGEANTASNIGASAGGEGVFAGKVGLELQFKTIFTDANLGISSTGSTITIDASPLEVRVQTVSAVAAANASAITLIQSSAFFGSILGDLNDVAAAPRTEGVVMAYNASAAEFQFDRLAISLIDANPYLTLTDPTRGDKLLTVDSTQLLFADDSLSNLEWVEIGDANNTDSGYIMRHNGTVVGVTGHCEDLNGFTQTIDLFINAAVASTIGTFTTASTQAQFNNDLNVDFSVNDRLRMRAGASAAGSIDDTVLSLWIKWRA